MILLGLKDIVMAVLGDTKIEFDDRLLNVLEEYVRRKARAELEPLVREIVQEELARVGITLKDGNLTIKGGGPHE